MSEPLTLAVEQGEALDPAPTTVPGYVPPTLTESDWPSGATVVLVEAAGAVGKSAAALAIASQLNWPLVRAEKAQVGSYSLSGLIQDATGFGSNYIAEVANGTAGVVIDSLDEAHFRAGSDNFLAFLDNVWKVAGTASTSPDRRPSIVLLSRSDTAELVRLAFLDAGVPLAHVGLDFFDRDGAERFIKAYMAQRFSETKRPEYNLPLASPGPFERLRNARMKQIAGVLLRRPDVNVRQEWEQVRDFLGYTPVLIAMAEALAVPNPAAEGSSLTAEDQSNLLREIIDHISLREQRKFSEHLQPKLQASLPTDVDCDVVAAAMYRPEEQCARVMAFVSGDEIKMPLPVSLPDAVRPAYEEAVRTFLPDHPFIKARRFASVVFGDYVTATACRSIEIRASLASPPEEGIESVGPFFARFLADEDGEAGLEVKESLVEHIVASWTQEADLVRANDSDVLISLLEGEGTLSCSREPHAGHHEPAELEFTIVDVSGAFHVRRPLKRTTLATDQGVILGESGRHFLIGPRVAVVASELIVEAETLRVDTDRGRSHGVAIASDSITANTLSKVEAGPQDLHVFSTNPPARLRPYMRSMSVGKFVIPFQRYLDLRTILTCFRPSTKGGLSVLAAKLDGKILKDNEHRARILGQLTKIGAISRNGSWYHLDLSTLGRLGFGLQDLKTGEPSDAVLRFLHACVHDVDLDLPEA
ncbi:MAG: hypothetical protein ACTHNS_00480 [Marmoricola sp.]